MKVELNRDEIKLVLDALDELTSIFDPKDVGPNEALSVALAEYQHLERHRLMNRLKIWMKDSNDGSFVPDKLILHTPSERGGKIILVNPADSDYVFVEWAIPRIDQPSGGKVACEWIHVRDLQIWE